MNTQSGNSRRQITTAVPGGEPIELVDYYPEFERYYADCEPQTKQWFAANIRPDWVILDCGANIGYFTILFARCAPRGHVYAFEPTSTFDKLMKNLEHHAVRNVTTLRCALGKKSGTLAEAGNRIWGNETEKKAYRFSTIDDFVFDNGLGRVDCIKIDVGSFDLEVLQGAEKTLRTMDPYIMVELNHALAKRNQSNAEALEWLAGRGYTAAEVFDYDNFLLKRSVQDSMRAAAKRSIILSFPSAPAAAPLSATAQHQPQADAAADEAVAGNGVRDPNVPVPEKTVDAPAVPVERLHAELGFERPLDYPSGSRSRHFTEWKMEVDDSPIFRYIYRNFKPARHLEFGTWQGTGTLYCLEESAATVWTLNMPFGEEGEGGKTVYSHYSDELQKVQRWARTIGLPIADSYRTDSIGFIGRRYLEKGFGDRVCQIYSDSCAWDISGYPQGFFDTALIDGGHSYDVVVNDTMKAFELVRPGGIIMWHDFCPPIADRFETVKGVVEAVRRQWKLLRSMTTRLFWVYPSFILLGVRK
jgi:FkbM family methyltransferase